MDVCAGLYTCNGGKLGMLKFPFLQTDNLPACVDNNADELRKRVVTCDNGWLKENLRSIPDILNRLLGTVFISGKGRRFAMFTFRHLNQSVLHWLAQGQLFGLRWKGRLPVQSSACRGISSCTGLCQCRFRNLPAVFECRKRHPKLSGRQLRR